ncbi:MAG: archease [Nitrospirae bacterium]|nr:archease [Nitrospirota bacterium]NTW67154.1 archease [Nitrospirota bacterium]
MNGGRKGYLLTVQYETFEHEADIGIRGFGTTLEEAFANAAAALYSVMVDITRVDRKEFRGVNVSADDQEQLLVEWLNALLAVSDIERLVFSRFEVRIEGNRLAGTAWGEHLDRTRHHAHVEVKGATYHMLSVRQEDGRYVVQCVVDV